MLIKGINRRGGVICCGWPGQGRLPRSTQLPFAMYTLVVLFPVLLISVLALTSAYLRGTHRQQTS